MLEVLPEGGWFVEVQMSDQLYTSAQSSNSITEGGGNGDVYIYIAMGRCGLSEEQMQQLAEALAGNLSESGLTGACTTYGYVGDAGTSLTKDAIERGEYERSWRESQRFSPEVGEA